MMMMMMMMMILLLLTIMISATRTAMTSTAQGILAGAAGACYSKSELHVFQMRVGRRRLSFINRGVPRESLPGVRVIPRKFLKPRTPNPNPLNSEPYASPRAL